MVPSLKCREFEVDRFRRQYEQKGYYADNDQEMIECETNATVKTAWTEPMPEAVNEDVENICPEPTSIEESCDAQLSVSKPFKSDTIENNDQHQRWLSKVQFIDLLYRAFLLVAYVISVCFVLSTVFYPVVQFYREHLTELKLDRDSREACSISYKECIARFLEDTRLMDSSSHTREVKVAYEKSVLSSCDALRQCRDMPAIGTFEALWKVTARSINGFIDGLSTRSLAALFASLVTILVTFTSVVFIAVYGTTSYTGWFSFTSRLIAWTASWFGIPKLLSLVL